MRRACNPDDSKRLLPKSAFACSPFGQLAGKLGRNLNASLNADWTLPADLKLNFRTEAINLSNTPQFAEPGNSLTDPNFRVITNTLNDGRALRFQLRLTF